MLEKGGINICLNLDAIALPVHPARRRGRKGGGPHGGQNKGDGTHCLTINDSRHLLTKAGEFIRCAKQGASLGVDYRKQKTEHIFQISVVRDSLNVYTFGIYTH